jgi:hypothetical protein
MDKAGLFSFAWPEWRRCAPPLVAATAARKFDVSDIEEVKKTHCALETRARMKPGEQER